VNFKQETPTIYIIAGPNGAGKTTFASDFLPDFVQCREFLNADLIAAGLSPFSPESQNIQAAEIMRTRMDELVTRRISFSFESTLAARSYSQLIPQWRILGFQVRLLFLWLNSEELAVSRVGIRVSQGGHDVPQADIRRRYRRGIKNLFDLYLHEVDSVHLYNNVQIPPRLVAEYSSGKWQITDDATFKSISMQVEE
jgi:predicted ABC-type ATPase